MIRNSESAGQGEVYQDETINLLASFITQGRIIDWEHISGTKDFVLFLRPIQIEPESTLDSTESKNLQEYYCSAWQLHQARRQIDATIDSKNAQSQEKISTRLSLIQQIRNKLNVMFAGFSEED